MELHKPHDKENTPPSTTRVLDDIVQDISQSGDAHDGGVMPGRFSSNDSNMTNADSVIGQGDFQNPDVNLESLSDHVASGVELTGDPKMSVLQHAQNIEGTGSKNDFQLSDAQFSSPKNVDNRCQTLEIGRNRQPSQQTSGTEFSTKEISGKLDEIVFQFINYSPIRKIRGVP